MTTRPSRVMQSTYVNHSKYVAARWQTGQRVKDLSTKKGFSSVTIMHFPAVGSNDTIILVGFTHV